jgi:hypothetical protein
MLTSHAARAAPPRNAEGDPHEFAKRPGLQNSNTAIPNGEQDKGSIDPRRLGLGLNACERALNEFSWPAALHAKWPELRRFGIRDDHASGRFMDALAVADVTFLEGGRSEFAAEAGLRRGTVAAFVWPIFDEFGEAIDVGAFCPESGMFGLLHGAACFLGAENIHASRIEHDGVRVHTNVLAWLRAGRTGVYVVDPQRARWRLAEERLIVDDPAFGRRLRDALRLPEPQVFVASRSARCAA